MAQRQADVHQDKLCPSNKCYALMDANKKINLKNSLCPNKSKIMANILQNHPLRFSIVASSSVSWIYLGQFWHTLKEDGSKYRLKFVLDKKEITITLNDFRRIFQLPQATDNNHERFVVAPKFSKMVSFFLNDLGFTLELRSSSNFKTTSHVQPWQTLELIVRRVNGSIVSITEPDYKNLNNNDIEDMYLLCINGKVDDYAETGLLWSLSVFIRSTVIWERVHNFQLGVESYQQNVNLTAPTITFSDIEKCKMFSIVSEPVYGIIYKNNKKEKRVIRHQEIHKFCDATLKRVLEGLKSYNSDVKHGYATPSLIKEDDEYLQLFEEEIKEQLKHHDQMRLEGEDEETAWKVYRLLLEYPLKEEGKLADEAKYGEFRPFLGNGEEFEAVEHRYFIYEALVQMPKYAKLFKDLLTNKTKLKDASRSIYEERLFFALRVKVFCYNVKTNMAWSDIKVSHDLESSVRKAIGMPLGDAMVLRWQTNNVLFIAPLPSTLKARTMHYDGWSTVSKHEYTSLL
ncbi:hypothetical protein Tco_0285231 [Tanacetum coccineum]